MSKRKPTTTIRIVATGLVYRNPQPYLSARHTWHPTLALLPSGELLAAFDLGQAVESFDYRTWLARSTDGGATWSAPMPLTGDHPTRPACSLVRIRAVSDGVVGLGAYLFRDDPTEGFVNRATFGYVPMDLFLIRSGDGGHTWSTPAIIQAPLVGPSFEICHALVELRDGRWLAPLGTWKGWQGDAPNGMKAVALVSRDRGRTWPEYLTIMDGYAQGVIHFEQSVVQLQDDRLLAIAWAFRKATGGTDPTPYVLSADGRTFSAPRPTGLNGQTAKLVCLNDGRLLCLYRRNDRPGLWANLSRLDGDDWVNLTEAPVWQGATSGMTGQAAAGDELGNLKFGFPNSVVLPDGTVFAVFWCAEDGINNIRWVRLAVD